MSKLRTQEEIQKVYYLWDSGITNKTEISRRVGIPRTTIRGILERRNRKPFEQGVVSLILIGTKADGWVTQIHKGVDLFGRKTAPYWRSQWWFINDLRMTKENLIGTRLVLCKDTSSPAYLGGTIKKACLTIANAWIFDFYEIF